MKKPVAKKPAKKSILAVIAVVAVCAILLTVGWNVYNNDHGFYFIKNADGTYEIVGVKDLSSTSLTIPETYCFKPVTRIGDFAFLFEM